MFPESSTWQADVVRVTADGRRMPVTEPWDGYRWAALVPSRGLAVPGRPPPRRRRARQPARLPRRRPRLRRRPTRPDDRETRYLEATVTAWHDDDPPHTVVLRSADRDVP